MDYRPLNLYDQNDKWKNEQAKEDMSALLEIRHAVNSLLEKARTEK
jgi:hypothetical protein